MAQPLTSRAVLGWACARSTEQATVPIQEKVFEIEHARRVEQESTETTEPDSISLFALFPPVELAGWLVAVLPR
jgi:hypothetical protein